MAAGSGGAGRPWPAWSGRDVAALLGILAVCLGIGWLGAAVTLPAIPTWYAGLAKPAFTPPNGVFGPVWTVLYVMIAVAVWRVARAPAAAGLRRRALLSNAAQLVANCAWSFAFFGARNPALGLAVIIVLVAAVLVAIARTATVDRPAAALLLPYLGWIAFAAVLNGAVVAMN